MCLTYAILRVKCFSGIFILENIFNFSLLILNMFYNNIVKISEILNKWNLWKTCIQSTYPIDFACVAHVVLQPFLLLEKLKIFIFFKINDEKKTFCA